ncbi:MAG: AEC family transporter [Bacteroidales bacterium]|nr:AEC family transporter [Bacteroidales bacterium]HOK97930.1 AEC family transporter [Bacteroidales bacterium]HPO64506.1 AEC family transporter [Bacteroidales bacterium]
MSQVLVEQFYVYFILILAGYIAAKTHIIHDDNASFLSAFILKITFPLLLVTTIPHLPFSTSTLKNLGLAFAISYLALGLLFLVGYVTQGMFRFTASDRKVFLLHSVFGNIVFIGFPFITSLFPKGEGLLYAAVFQIASDSLLWTLGIASLQRTRQRKSIEYLKKLFNINTLAFIVALLWWIFQVRIPTMIERPFAAIGSTTLTLSLVYVGYILSQVAIDKTIRKGCIYILSFNKLLLVPIVVLALLWFFLPHLPKAMVAAIVLQTGMPAMATIAILAREYLEDDLLASENILVSTIFSTISLPLLWYLINLLFP